MPARILLYLAAFCFLAIGSAAADEAVARRLIISQGCKGCHQLEGDGGQLGPALDTVGKRLSAARIRQSLIDPKANDPDSRMPSFAHLTEDELQSLVDFLKTRK